MSKGEEVDVKSNKNFTVPLEEFMYMLQKTFVSLLERYSRWEVRNSSAQKAGSEPQADCGYLQ